MGRGYSLDKKGIVEESLDLDVFWLKKHGYFCGYKYGGITWTYGFGNKSSINMLVRISDEEKYIQLIYSSTDRLTDQKMDYNYRVAIVASSCTFGGVRYWFLCPLTIDGVACNRRVAKLYLGTKYFGCRHCHNLTYDARQNHNKRFDLLGRTFDYDRRSEKLYSQIKRKYYQGKPTRKYARFLQYCTWLDERGPMLLREMDRIFGKK